MAATPDWLTARPIAHRALHDLELGRPENSLPAVAAAIAGRFAIELDLQLSADGEVIVFHDDDLDRLTAGTGPVRTRRAAELRTMTLSGTQFRIPTLAEVLAMVGGRVPLVLELKSDWRRPADPALVTAVGERLASYSGPAALMSFDPEIVAQVRRLVPGRPRGIVADRAEDPADYPGLSERERFSLRHLTHAIRTRPDFVAYDVHALPMPGPTMLRQRFGRPLLTWTVRTAEDRERARHHADQMIFEGFVPEG